MKEMRDLLMVGQPSLIFQEGTNNENAKGLVKEWRDPFHSKAAIFSGLQGPYSCAHYMIQHIF